MYRLRIDFSDRISPLNGYVLIKNCEISCRISACRSCEKQLTEVSPRQISRGTYVSRVGTPDTLTTLLVQYRSFVVQDL